MADKGEYGEPWEVTAKGEEEVVWIDKALSAMTGIPDPEQFIADARRAAALNRDYCGRPYARTPNSVPAPCGECLGCSLRSMARQLKGGE